jgi:predicted GH43/DUF377 family glycosyl hydrolase
MLKMMSLLKPRKKLQPPIEEIGSIVTQAANKGWLAGIFDFAKAKQPGVDWFNCGVIERADGTWLITRRSQWKQREDFGYNDIMAFKLEDVRPIVGVKVHMGTQFPHEHFEDPRAVMVNGRTFISACNFIRYRVGQRETMTWPHQMISEVNMEWQLVQRWDPAYGFNGRDSGSNTHHEKNWLWWWRNGHPHLIYGASPHQVVPFDNNFRALGVRDPASATCHSETGCGPMEHGMLKCWETKWNAIVWRYGTIRGGTPPVLVGNELITFFHSSTPWTTEKRQYHMGAYAFENKPPFRITRITREPLLTGSRFDRWYPSKPPCFFVVGSLLRNGEWLLTGGCNDIDCAFVKIPAKDIQRLLEPL